MLWINFFHLYQPANADGHKIKEATEKSYLRILRALEENENAKFTLNINGCLFLRWEDLGYIDIYKRISALINKGRLELTGNAAYHPLLPLIDKSEAQKQIEETETILHKYLDGYKPKGFFMSEMAYGTEPAKIIKSKGYNWIILDEISYNGKLGQLKNEKIFMDENSGLKIIFRDRKLSQTYVPETVSKLLKEKESKEIITACDGELVGLRHIDHTAEFEKLIKNSDLEMQLISNYIESRKNFQNISPMPSSWESTEKELEQKKPYAVWHNDDNPIQKKLWSLADLAYRSCQENHNDPNYGWARWHLIRGLASCTFWWASGKDFNLFAPISWNPDEIERGVNELVRSVRALENESTRELKMKAEKYYIEIKQLIWEQHWTYHWKKNIN